MSAVVRTAAVPATRSISPVLVTLLVFIGLGLRHIVQLNGDVTVGLGLAGLMTWVVWAIYGAIAVAVVMAAQRWARRPAFGILLALAWGGLAATFAAESANSAASTIFERAIGDNPAAFVSAPVIEETAKALGVLGLALIPIIRRFRALDGLFYGVLVGAGFQVVEDGIFTLTAIFHNPTNPEVGIIGNLILRGLTIGIFTHAVFTGLVGAGIGWVASGEPGKRGTRVVAALALLAFAIGSHSAFNTQNGITPINIAASFGPFLVLLAAIRWTRAEELRHLAAEATTNGGWGVLTPADIATIDGPKPADRAARGFRDAVRTFAWATDHLGADSGLAVKARSAIDAARSATR